MTEKYYTYVLFDPRTNQPFYVGKGKGRRMYQHVYARRRHINVRLSDQINSILDQGLDILYEKVLVNATEQQASNKEMDLIGLYGRLDLRTGSLCNLTSGGERSASSWSPETRQRKRESELAKKKGRPVSQYTLGGEHIQDFPSAKLASEHTPANRSYITQVCKGKRISAGGFLWTYQGNDVPVFSKAYYRAVKQFNSDGQLLAEFQSLTEAQNSTGVELHNISECCRGKSQSAGGFAWTYA